VKEQEKPSRFRITSIIIAIAFLLPMLILLGPNATSPAAAFPTTDPLPSEYLFYDDFEDGLSANWYVNTGGGYSAPDLATNQSYHGTHSAYFGLTNKMLRYNLSGETDICIEVWFYDIATDETELSSLILNNDTTNVRLGVRSIQSSTFFSSCLGSSFYSLNYYRYTGWVNLKMVLTDGTVREYINNDFVGEYPFTNIVNVEWRSEIYSTNTWIDQFIIYPLWQDQIWIRPESTDAIITYNDSWSQKTLAEPNVLYEDGIYKMWYRGVNYSNIPKFNHPSGLGYATSVDGLTWTEYYDNPVAPLGWCPTVHKIGSTYYLYDSSTYAPGGVWSFARKTSIDGITWTASATTDLTVGTGTWDDQYLGNNEFWYEDGTWYMLYECSNLSSSWKIGLATSTNGMNWTKYPGNPIIGTATRTAGGPHVLKVDGIYYCWYHIGGLFTEVALKQSTDLHTWTEAQFSIQLPRDPLRPKEDRQTADPFVSTLGTSAIMYYCGTNNDTNGEIFAVTSDYSVDELVQNQVLQWGKQWIGNIGTTNNITAGYPRTYWYSGINAMKGSYFYDWNITTTSDVNITILARNSADCRWTADAGTGSPAVAFTLSGLVDGSRYKVYVDGNILANLIANGGVISFSYSGPWSEHQFEVIGGVYSKAIVGLGVVLGIMLVIGVVVSVLVPVVEVAKEKRKFKAQDFIHMVVYIVISIALLGVVYAVLP